MPTRNFNLMLLAVVVSVTCHITYRSVRTAAILGEAIELIEQNYVDPVDQRKLVMAAMEGVVKQLDEHSSYFSVDVYESFQDSIHQEFAGIGIYVDQPQADGPVRVVTPLVDSPALRAGVLPNDRITQVDGQDVTKWPLADVSERLKGVPGTVVSLVVTRGTEQHRMTVERATIELESVVGDHRGPANEWGYRLDSRPRVAYIRLKSFGEKTVRELERVLIGLNNDFDAMVLDLRGNGGGLLYAARDVSDMFLEQGQIVSTRIRNGKIEDSYAATPGTLVDPGKPLAVLIDENSASASEIVAACLQDNARATIVGTRSYGKGTVQEIMPLEYGRSALRLTVARYFRPNDKNIHRRPQATEADEWGVTPDSGFIVPMQPAEIAKLADRWRDASFPLLAGIDLDATDSELTDPNQEIMASALPGQLDSAAGEDDPIGSLDRPAADVDANSQAPAPPALSEQARANVERGPADLADDPPLRAAVGHLLRQATESKP